MRETEVTSPSDRERIAAIRENRFGRTADDMEFALARIFDLEAEIEADKFRKTVLQESIDGCAQRVQRLHQQAAAVERERDRMQTEQLAWFGQAKEAARRAEHAESALLSLQRQIQDVRALMETGYPAGTIMAEVANKMAALLPVSVVAS